MGIVVHTCAWSHQRSARTQRAIGVRHHEKLGEVVVFMRNVEKDGADRRRVRKLTFDDLACKEVMLYYLHAF